MNKKLTYIIGVGILMILVGFMLSNNPKKSQLKEIKNVSYVTPKTGLNTTISQDPQDVVPGLYKNLIQNTATKEGFTIAAIVENNSDEAGKTVDDHLELTLKNTAGHDLTDFETYYTITDPTTNKKEGYYKKLTGFVLRSGETQHIHFDNKQGAGHFTANKNGIYYTSNNKLLFNVTVSASLYKIQTVQIEKAAGGAEVKD